MLGLNPFLFLTIGYNSSFFWFGLRKFFYDYFLTFDYFIISIFSKQKAIFFPRGEIIIQLLRKIFHVERRHCPRYKTWVDVNLYIFDAFAQRPLTRKVAGCISNISRRGACLQTNYTRIENYHMLLDVDMDGKTVLMIELPPLPDGTPSSIKAKVVSYNRVENRGKYQFDVGVEFIHIAPRELQHLENLIKRAEKS